MSHVRHAIYARFALLASSSLQRSAACPTSHPFKTAARCPYSLRSSVFRSFASMAPIERVTNKLEVPALDDRSYRVIRLPNKVEALIVHDPDTDKASAAVNVNVGSFSDADDMPGMAHAVEHLLFMGTKKASIPVCTSQPILTPFTVPKGERLQPVPHSPFRLFKCIHSFNRDQLLLRSRSLIRGRYRSDYQWASILPSLRSP